MIDLYGRLSSASRYQRFFAVAPNLPELWAEFLTNVDCAERLGLVAEPENVPGRGIIALAQYEPCDEVETAEVALVVDDAWQGKGLGGLLFDQLLRAAEAQGIRRFIAHVYWDNTRVIRALARTCAILDRTVEGGVVRLTFTRLPG